VYNLKLFNREKTIQKSDKSFVERARDLQKELEAKRSRIGKGKYGRVLKMARKPTNDEFTKTSKITFLGILLIGSIGFAIFLIATEVAPWVAGILGL
jgi:protein transport protein SEC61 subunit gamma and related proteins